MDSGLSDDAGPDAAADAEVDAEVDAEIEDAAAEAATDAEADADAADECPLDMPADCLGVCGGSATLDCSGVCDGDATCPVAPGSVIVSEVMFNPLAVDDTAGEWFELYNPTAATVSLMGCTIADNAMSVTIAVTLDIPSQGYATFSRGGSPGFTPSFDFGVSTLQLSNSSDEIVVTCGGAEIERFEYMASSYATQRPGASLSIPTAALTVEQHTMTALWCAGSSSYNGDFGTPGAANPPCVLEPDEGDVVITEIMANPIARMDSEGEWLELHNTRGAVMDLTGCSLRDDDMDEYALPGTITIPAFGYVAFSCAADPGFTPLHVYPLLDLTLANSDDELVLVCDGAEIDRVAYVFGSVPNGASWSLDPDSTSALGNDTAANWCAATTAYDTDLGTPGASNDECP